MTRFVRPAQLSDLDALARMARAARPVLHSLPHDVGALAECIALSERSFRAQIDVPGEEIYLFVLEDSASGALLGTASIVAASGDGEPFYVFRRDALIHASRELRVNRKVHVLTMSHELSGKSRLAGFYIDSLVSDDAAARLLSRARMMYIAANRERFTSDVFSLLLGITDAHGVSPFWQAVGAKFFHRNFIEIEMASGGRSRIFIAEVMPSYPLYVPLLPQAAQNVLGEVNVKAQLSYRIHLEEGFEPDRFIDIFDAGPVLSILIDRSAASVKNEIRTVADIVEHRVANNAQVDGAKTMRTYLVANAQGHDFRCVLAELPDEPAAGARLTTQMRELLKVSEAQPVRCVPVAPAVNAVNRWEVRS